MTAFKVCTFNSKVLGIGPIAAFLCPRLTGLLMQVSRSATLLVEEQAQAWEHFLYQRSERSTQVSVIC